MSSVSTAFKVHYNQKLGDPFGHLWGDAPWPLGGGDRRPWFERLVCVVRLLDHIVGTLRARSRRVEKTLL